MKQIKSILILCLLFMAGMSAWAQNNVITYTATSQIEVDDMNFGYNWVEKGTYDPNTQTGVITFRNDVTTIEGGDSECFRGCTSLISINLPASVTTIGKEAFRGCTSLTSINLPASVNSIGNYAFEDCTSLDSVTINSQATLNACGFYNNVFGDQATEVILNGDITSIPLHKFLYSKIRSVSISENVTTIENEAFLGCENLTSIRSRATTPPTIESDAFYMVNKDIPVYVPISSIGAYKAAEGWKEFTNVTIKSVDEYSLSDKANFMEPFDSKVGEFTYTRIFSDSQKGKWQPLFVPFDIDLTDDVLSQADIAKPYMVATAGATDGGMNEDEGGDIVVLKKLKLGDTAMHGTAYFIRPKEEGEFRLDLEDVVLYQSDYVTTLTCATTEDDYAFVGQYTSGKPSSGTWYALGGGVFNLGDSQSLDLAAQRWYMTKTSKSGVQSLAKARTMQLMTWGEDDEASGIKECLTPALSKGDGTAFNLNGMRMNGNPSTGSGQAYKGIVIKNGKKILIR